MEEQIISFQVAKLAAKKGFNESSYYGYDKTTKKLDDGALVRCIYAPTQSLLQKWLREKYNKHPEITPAWYKNNILHWNLKIGNTYYKDKYKTYEEALEEWLYGTLSFV